MTDSTPATAATERYGVPDDPEATEHLRKQLIAITEAERKALNDAACFIAASSHLPGVQGLAGAVLNVANRGASMPTDPTATAACAFGDPACPCQDGDVCHYVDDPKSETLAMTPITTAALAPCPTRAVCPPCRWGWGHWNGHEYVPTIQSEAAAPLVPVSHECYGDRHDDCAWPRCECGCHRVVGVTSDSARSARRD